MRDEIYSLYLCRLASMVAWARTIARGLPGVEGPPGLAAIAHLCVVLRARGAAFGRTAGASTYVRYTSEHQKRGIVRDLTTLGVV